MNKNTQVETTQKSQATNKDMTPTGKVKTIKSAEERRKAREEQYRTFRINALKRRCKRMKMSDEDIEKYVKKLIEQMDAPKEYSILVMLSAKDSGIMKEALAKANINYKYHGDTYFSFEGDKKLLDKLREIAPPGAKFHIYAKKAESVLPKADKEVIKKPTNNTAEAKKKAKAVRKEINKKRGMHKKGNGKFHAKQKRILSLSERKKQRKATTVQLKGKTRSTGSKKASTSLKKAA